MAGEQITFQILDQPGNSTAPLLSITDLASLGAVMNLADGTMSIRGRAPRKMPRTTTGLTLIPVTKAACERWETGDSPPEDACLAPKEALGTAHVVPDEEANLVEDPAKEPSMNSSIA